MSIARVDSKTVIKAGQIVLCKVATDLCGHPRLVTRDVTSTRVHFKRLAGDLQDQEDFMSINSIAFVCDTIEEAEQLRTLSDEQAAAHNAAAMKVAIEFRERLRALMDENRS